jgi:hypothetical protein
MTPQKLKPIDAGELQLGKLPRRDVRWSRRHHSLPTVFSPQYRVGLLHAEFC